MKTADLVGAALDWAVAKCEGRDARPGRWRGKFSSNGGVWKPSENWAQGGPIIERERIAICEPGFMLSGEWEAFIAPMLDYRNQDIVGKFEGAGLTPLIAAMRCYVASKLGPDVDVPESLL